MEEGLPHDLEGDTTVTQEPEAMLASHDAKKEGDLVQQLLIQWKGTTVEEATWEEEFNIRSQEGGNDRISDIDLVPNGPIPKGQSRPTVWRVYTRKNKKGMELHSKKK